MPQFDIRDPYEVKRLLRRRRLMGGDRFDEVWNGVYVMSPLADPDHQELATALSGVLRLLKERGPCSIFAGLNVSDRPTQWKKNFRCPDVAVYFPSNPAKRMKAHYVGGPDFAVEIASPYDRSREKFDFYASVGVRELLIVDRNPWLLELFRADPGGFESVGTSDSAESATISSRVLDLTFRLVDSDPRPSIEVYEPTSGRIWLA